MINEICGVCYSFAHQYLTACPACGASRASTFEAALRDWTRRDQPYSREEAIALLNALSEGLDEFPELVALLRVTEDALASEMEGARWERRRRSAARRIELPEPLDLAAMEETRRHWDDAPLSAERRQVMEAAYGRLLKGHESEVQRLTYPYTKLDQWFTTTQGFRYLGGLPTHPYVTDVDLRADRQGFWVIARAGGGVIALIPYAAILAANAVSERMSIGWFGLAFGNVISLANPTIDVGGWIITFAQQGVLRQLAIGGRRAGLFGRTQTEDFFRVAVIDLSSLVNNHADYLESQVGPIEYARQLGLPVADVEQYEFAQPAD